MAYGAAGCVTTTANMFPELVVSIYDKCVAGDYKGALADQRKLTPIRLQMDKASFPVGTKDLANLMGLDVGDPYLPNHSSGVPGRLIRAPARVDGRRAVKMVYGVPDTFRLWKGGGAIVKVNHNGSSPDLKIITLLCINVTVLLR